MDQALAKIEVRRLQFCSKFRRAFARDVSRYEVPCSPQLIPSAYSMDQLVLHDANALGNLRPAAVATTAVGPESGPQATPAYAFDSHAPGSAGIAVLGQNPDRNAGEIPVNSSAAATSAFQQGSAAGTRLQRSHSASGDASTAAHPLRIGSSNTAALVSASRPALRRASSATGCSALPPGMQSVDNPVSEGPGTVARQQHTVMPTLAQGASGRMLQGRTASSSGASVPAPPVPAGTGGQDPPQRRSARLATARQQGPQGTANRSPSASAAIGGPQSAVVGTAAPTPAQPAVSSTPLAATLSSPHVAACLPQEVTSPMAPGQPALHGAVSTQRHAAPTQPAVQVADVPSDQQASAAPGSATHSQLAHDAADEEFGSPLGEFSSPSAASDRQELSPHAPDMHARFAAVAGHSSQPADTAAGATATIPDPLHARDGSASHTALTPDPLQARGGCQWHSR